MIILRCITILLNSVSGKVSDMKEVDFMSNFHLSDKKQCKTVYLKIFGPKPKQCPIKVSVQ